MHDPLVQRVVDRHLIRLAAREACGSNSARVASAGLTPEVVAAFAEGFYLPHHRGRVAFGGLTRKLKQLVEAFKKAPRLWEKFKSLLGVTGLAQLPGAIKDLAKRGYKALRKVVSKLFEKWPLKLYTLDKGQLMSFNDLIGKLLDKSPGLKRALESGARKFGDFGEMLRKAAPTITGVAMVGIYLWVWMNVVEFEWDFRSLTDAITGAMSFHDFMASLPGSAFGFILNAFNLGTFTLLPYAVAARFLWLLANRYLEWTGRGFRWNAEALQADFGISWPMQGRG